MGRYAMSARIDGNRWWYVTAQGFRSRTVHQRVPALITLAASADARGARRSGHVHRQRLTVARGRADRAAAARTRRAGSPSRRAGIGPASSFSIDYAFAGDGAYQLRAYLRWERAATSTPTRSPIAVTVNGIFKIKHVVIIMQENRSFDQYFGTFPGRRRDSRDSPATRGPCRACPIRSTADACSRSTTRTTRTSAARTAPPTRPPTWTAPVPRRAPAARWTASWPRPRRARTAPATTRTAARAPRALTPSASTRWAITTAARSPTTGRTRENYVLQDHMYEPNASWSLPEHLFQVSEWSAFCTDPLNPYLLHERASEPESVRWAAPLRLDRHHLPAAPAGVSWGYYVFQGTEPDCESDSAMTCAPVQQGPKTPGIWNPLPSFTDVAQDGQLGNIQTLSNFFAAAQSGHAAGRVLDRPQRQGLRASHRAGQRRPDVRHRA